MVAKCQNKATQAIAAVKMMNKSKLSEDDLKATAREVEIVKHLDHPNIVKMFESYEDKKHLYIVTELIEGGELFDELSRRKKFSEKDCACVVKQILEVLSYCHANDIVHKDLKPENILLQTEKNIEHIKVIDFGTAQRFDRTRKMTESLGTPYYVAPEVLLGSYDEK